MIKAILMDIEGTTSSISFVHDTLFPYAQQYLSEFVHQQYAHNTVVIEQVRQIASAIQTCEDDLDAVCAQLEEWMRTDSKATPLKTLQGLVWKAGYKRGNFKGHVYPDVARSFWRWQAMGIDLYVYSSGSIEAQKLIFGYSMAGNLNRLFKGYFDTLTGPKREVASYLKIANEINLSGEEILFLSDMPEELFAAQDAGMKVTQVVRDGATALQNQFPMVRDFNEINLEHF